MTESEARIIYATQGYRLFRNNSGVASHIDADGRVRPVRYGLANDSARLNERIKSSDLIGWRPIVITPEMVGQTIAQFVSIEAKAKGWRLTPSDLRGQAQKRWIDLINADGGLAFFACD